MKNSAFFGDSAGGFTVPNNVDISQGTAANDSGGGDAERWINILRKAEPNHWAWKDSQQTKRVTDELRMSLSGKGTTPEQDSLLRQESPENEADEYTEQAERMTRDMERNGIRLGNARDKFVGDMAQRLRGGPATPARRQEPEEEAFSSEKFWSNPEELKKAGKMVRPRKL